MKEKDGADMLVSVLALIIPNMDDSDETFECLAFTVRLAGGKVTFCAF